MVDLADIIGKALFAEADRDASKEVRSLVAYCKRVQPGYKAPPHIMKLADALERVERGELKRLIVAMPPRHGKSETTSKLFPAWYLGRNPGNRVIFGTYAQDFAETWGRKVRNIIQSDEHRAVFPMSRVSDDSSAAGKFTTPQGGEYKAAGRGVGISGLGANLVVIDDALKDRAEANSPTVRQALKDWFEEAVDTRLEPGAAIVVVATRWHEDDLSGWLITNDLDNEWELIIFPALAEAGDPLGRKEGEALWPERYGETYLLAKQKRNPFSFAALYQQRPTALEGGTFKRAWINYYTDPPGKEDIQRIVQSYDTAFKEKEANDFSVCTTWAVTATGYYLLHVWRERASFPRLLEAAKEHGKQWKPHAIILEDKASGTSLGQQLGVETRLPVIPTKVLLDKKARAEAAAPLWEAGKVFVPADAGWLATFLDELCNFPNVKHDDQVDTVSQVCEYFRLNPMWDGEVIDLGEDMDRRPFKGPRGFRAHDRGEQRPWEEVLPN